MESLTQTHWDVVISGTGLQQSLLALALSRSDKKVLHVDRNDYYGGPEAAFSLQEAEEWVEKVNSDYATRPFRNASLWRADPESLNETEKLSFSRAYTLTLSPQIIYTKSNLLTQLVSSKVYRQLEFQAVGNWWIYTPLSSQGSDAVVTLKRLPNGREDIFTDSSIDNRSKRSLMKFLKFVLDYETHPEIWEAHSENGLPEFLSSQFQLAPSLQTIIVALTLSLDSPDETRVAYALPRIVRHLTSIGVFGPGFGAVMPKWGGGSEITQVSCRAGAVGGGVYVLGTGVQDFEVSNDEVEVVLSNGETVKTRSLLSATYSDDKAYPPTGIVSKIIAIVSSPLVSLFASTVEGAPSTAVSVVVFPSSSIVIDGVDQASPVYIMAHSSETGECPSGQCILYASTLHSSNSKFLLETAISTFLKTAEDGKSKLLYSIYYEQQRASRATNPAPNVYNVTDPSLDLAFDDEMLAEVEEAWNMVMRNKDDVPTSFMQFEERNAMNDDDDGSDEGYY